MHPVEVNAELDGIGRLHLPHWSWSCLDHVHPSKAVLSRQYFQRKWFRAYAHPVLAEQMGGDESQYPERPEGFKGERIDVP